MEDIIAQFKHAVDGSIVQLYSDRVVIDRSKSFSIGLSGARGLEVNSQGKHISTIPLHTIKELVFNEAVKLFFGERPGVLDFVVNKGSLENRVFFNLKDSSAATKIKDYIEEYLKNAPKTDTTVVQQVSSADELKKFKDLLDMGVITQEEFDAKKKQLLGL